MTQLINIKETTPGDWGQFFFDYEVIHEERTDEQHLLLIETKTYGRVLLLDNVVQVTEKDNFIYHECLTHVPIIAHGNCKNVLIIGGGDGGMAKEVLKYPDINVTMVEIDETVVSFSKLHLSSICEDAFENTRLNLIIEDGCKFVKETDKRFDVIIVDSTDPIGPGEALFTKKFYSDCKEVLNSDGILVTQNGIPFTQGEELSRSVKYFKELFKVGTCYLGTVPTYVGGPMAFGFATDNTAAHEVSTAEIKTRYEQAGVATKYYNSEVHKAAFAHPNYIQDIIS